MTMQDGRGRRMGVFLIVAGLLALASAPPALGADRLYWGNGGTDTISYANLDGSGGGGELNTSGATPGGPRGVVIDAAAGRIYWANQNTATISYANLDGSGGGDELNTSGATITKPHGLAIDPTAGRIYWADSGNTVSYANLDGSGGDDLDLTGATPDAPYGATIDPAAGRIYWANLGNNTISYANLDGSGGGDQLDITGSNPDEPHGLVIDHATGRIYWTNLISTISYANINGSGGGGELNLTGATEKGGVGLAVDPTTGRLFWGNLGSNGNPISYVNADGTGGGGLLDTSPAIVSQARFPALLRAPSGTGAPQISGSSIAGSVLSCSPGSWAPDVLASFFYRAPQSIAYQWSRDGADIAGATESSYTPSLSGDYRCRETATNAAGSTSQTSDPHPVLGPPDTKLTKTKMDSRRGKVTFKFTATGHAWSFGCKLNRPDKPTPVKECSSPMTYKGLPPGRYRFQVRAYGPAGPDPTASEKRVTVR
jgi:DNA-binding beta-propeller fold protein YncE